MRLQNISVTSSRAPVRSVWTNAASSVSRLASPTFLMSFASVTCASPAKFEIFPGGTPLSHTSVGPSASRSARWLSRSLNLPSVADFAGSFSRSNRLRRVAGSTISSSRSLARWLEVNLADTVPNTPVFTSVRILATIRSSVV